MLLRRVLNQGALAFAFGDALNVMRTSAQAQQRWLISPEERAASAQAGKASRSTSDFDYDESTESDPVVEILLPRIGQKIVSPVDFDVRFRTTPPAVIDAASVRVLYGFMQIDITRRIKEFGGEITASGINLVKAPLQPDSYTVTVEVANSRRQKTRRTVRFIVV